MILHLIRHPPVAKLWQKRCYGQSDPGLSREGRAIIASLVDRISALNPEIVVHSNMIRTRVIAEPLARRLGISCIADPLWRERDFGAWEGLTWNTIYRATGSAMDRMISEPEHFRPGGGETTADLLLRVHRAYELLPEKSRVAVFTHGGPIACARIIAGRLPLRDLPKQIPPLNEIVTIDLN
jgi:broad specificity phosphatase PhoE